MLLYSLGSSKAPPDSAGRCRAQTASLKGYNIDDADLLLCTAGTWGMLTLTSRLVRVCEVTLGSSCIWVGLKENEKVSRSGPGDVGLSF